jgi:hypothetical protein
MTPYPADYNTAPATCGTCLYYLSINPAKCAITQAQTAPSDFCNRWTLWVAKAQPVNPTP